MKKAIIISIFILATSCNISTSTTKENNISTSTAKENNITIDTSIRKQNQLKQKWIQDTQIIIQGSYKENGENLWFDKTSLWKEDRILYSLLDEGEASFIDEKTAIMTTPQITPTLERNLYIIRISNNTIYRTKNPNGFIPIDKWDGKTVTTNDLISIAQKHQAKSCFLTEIQGINYQYAFKDWVGNSLNFEIKNNGNLFQVGTEQGFIDNRTFNIKYIYYTKGIDDYYAIYKEIQAQNKNRPKYRVFKIDPTTKIVYIDCGGVYEEAFDKIQWNTPHIFMSPKK